MDLRGVYAILPTPFDEDGEIDWHSLRTLVEFEIRHGVLPNEAAKLFSIPCEPCAESRVYLAYTATG